MIPNKNVSAKTYDNTKGTTVTTKVVITIFFVGDSTFFLDLDFLVLLNMYPLVFMNITIISASIINTLDIKE